MLRSNRDERGFTLLEILIAMIILAVGGVSILSLFAAAVKLQYSSVVDQRKAVVLAEVTAEAQDILNRHKPTEDHPVPPDPDLTSWAEENCPRDFTVSLTYSEPASFPSGEGAAANITLFYRDRPVHEARHILLRTVFSDKEIEESVSYKQEQAAREARKGRDEDK